MMSVKRVRFQQFLLSLTFACFFGVSAAHAYTSLGKPSGYVNDFAHVLTAENKNALEDKLVTFNASTTNEIAVVTVPDLGGDYIEHYASELFKEWGIGTKKNNNGVLLLVAVKDHTMRIEVGYGLEKALTDVLSSQIIRNDLTPAFKQNDFYGGIDTATDNIIRATRGEYAAEPIPADPVQTAIPYVFISFFILLFVLPMVLAMAAALARSTSWYAGGIAGSILGTGITVFMPELSLIYGFLLILILTAIGVVLDYIVSKKYKELRVAGKPIPWWIRGQTNSGGDSSSSSSSSDSYSSSSSSSSSSSGFSGGSSGGGGASGSW